MADRSAIILERFRAQYGTGIDLTLRPAYRDLLAAVGHPQKKLPPVFHVAGTNGKGSTCAFLRAALESAGCRVHVYTSPHLVRFHERIRLAGRLIDEDELADTLAECEAVAQPGGVTLFEVATVAAFIAFARHSADFTILETGLGGRLDATNVVPNPVATLITRLSYDHREYLGDTIEAIAREKAGIMHAGVPCFASSQPDARAAQTLREAAAAIGADLRMGGSDWRVDAREDGFRFVDAAHDWFLPSPALPGRHQYDNAGLALAALSVLSPSLPCAAAVQAMRAVEWPARLQRLQGGALSEAIPPGAEFWLDGGHNDSAGEVLAAQIAEWRRLDGACPRPLYVILGMLMTKRPEDFLGPFAPMIAQLRTVAIEGDALGFAPDELARRALVLGVKAEVAPDLMAAVSGWVPDAAARPPRILCAGSLHLAGQVLRQEQPV